MTATGAADRAGGSDGSDRARTGAPGGALVRRLAELEGALARGGPRVPGDVQRTVRSALDTVGERLLLGVDHTVVALLGGTGSGKSSLFNALSGLRFADVGARRPTTARATACTWGVADPLLDWLGVDKDRRIERESALDGNTQADLRGLVLLDLPDHDSVAAEHREVVDRLLPMADLLVWVLDPQKYADDALHSGYLRRMAGHEGSMLVVLNQVDTVPVDAQGSLLRDVARLLREDGLSDVPVHAVSALTGDGVPVLRGAIGHAVAGQGTAERSARAELADAAAELSGAVGAAEPRNLPRDTTVEDLLAAVGVPALVDAVRADAHAELVPPQPERVEHVHRRWLDTVTPDLPEPWQRAVRTGIVPAERLGDEVAAAVASVRAPEPDPTRARRGRSLALACGVLALVAAAVVVVGGLLGDALVAGVAGGAALVLGAGAVAARSRSRRAADADRERRASVVLHDARTAVGTVVDTGLVGPTRSVLADHRAVRRAAAGEDAPAPSRAGAAGPGDPRGASDARGPSGPDGPSTGEDRAAPSSD